MIVPAEADRIAALRYHMIREQLEKRGIRQSRILAAFRRVPRHLFTYQDSPELAYSDQPLPLSAGQTISQPYVVALMLSYLQPEAHHRVLEIGTGSGYATALLAELSRQVDSLEVFAELLRSARRVLQQLEIANVELIHGSAWEQTPEKAVYDRIILWASPPKVPENIFNGLKDGGILVAPVGKHKQYVKVFRRAGEQVREQKRDQVRFVPLVQGSVSEIDREGQ